MKAIPFHSSVRIKLGAGQQITNKNKEVIGIHVNAKTIKNKVSPPFRDCQFEIHFGKGIFEHEQIFDVLRKHGSEEMGENIVEVGGNGSWKSLTVHNKKTGEVLVEKKFYKNDFNHVLSDPEFSQYCDFLLEKAMTRIMRDSEHMSVDHESYEEVRSIAMDLESEILDPES